MFRLTFISAGISAGLAIAGFLCVDFAATAQDAAAQPQASPKEWLHERQVEFDEYEFATGASRPQKLMRESRSLLNWSNAERGADVGAVFLWTLEGRPQLVACAFGRGKSLRHEFHSLSEGPLIAEREGAEIHRFEPGIVWRKLAGAPPAASKRALRLAQMRRQAERFRVVMGTKDPAEMRLLPQPVFRSPAELDEDMALFVFVQGTDPECVLLLEATAEGQWQYAVTRQTKWPLRVELDGTQVAEFTSIGKTPAGSPFLVLTPPTAAE